MRHATKKRKPYRPETKSLGRAPLHPSRGSKKRSRNDQILPGEKPFYIEHSEAQRFLTRYSDDLFDSMVTDPPAGIDFMKLSWDSSFGARDAWISRMTSIFDETFRVLKPGAFGLVWAYPKTSHWTALALENAGFSVRDRVSHVFATGMPKGLVVRAKDLPLFDGFGTGLKPCMEDWWLVQKQMEQKVLDNLRCRGTGALNLPACGVDGSPGQRPRHAGNFLHDGSEEVLNYFPEAPGQLVTLRGDGAQMGNKVYSPRRHGNDATPPRIDDSRSAERFFFNTKASPSDKNEGLLPGEVNPHLTVKSTRLMRWLVRLVTPPGGMILDPFLGSGSTGKAAMLERFKFVVCDQCAEYVTAARARISHARQKAAKK